ncbi:hypothetical protein GGE07_002506 [Sinorhizobium terangae]|uniref:Uncharacterized protein n=1 Tax=Sinorhizobium terangae TaxID=110322 RepID=A0A6N7LJ08_SINTE|nr:hypothetical protein [Sinorhizobium terangae]MBB4185856.1 hypothetical protein [Sinorhizobium terangae]MQX17767.1 hypothetical protein [Sinorhizobium terangae]
MSIITPYRAIIDALSTASAKAQPIRKSLLITGFRDLNAELPLRLSEENIGVVLDAHGRDVFTIDVNNERPDEEVLAIAHLIVECVNAEAGFSTEKFNG